MSLKAFPKGEYPLQPNVPQASVFKALELVTGSGLLDRTEVKHLCTLVLHIHFFMFSLALISSCCVGMGLVMLAHTSHFGI